MLFFRSEEHVQRWCEKWKQSYGETISLAQSWGLAQAWYSDRLALDFQRKTLEEAHDIFASLAMTSDFWSLTKSWK
ncbi:MAG: hypothetical protein DWQ07_08255 [Chloroflexi bacterium]|nr:MAG: hypothetical protein DWQ07_08255 [Chloroflexota bacterium]MBL1193297.1 hypothetical protein [Chloroflexota bacterium]NOH10589.1 hypothetical protein [Chloroflexota bacterium]